MDIWKEMIETGSDAQLIGIWENGTYMDTDEYLIWLEEVRRRGLLEAVFGGGSHEDA